MTVTQHERDRAARVGRLAARAGRCVGDACPYDADGSAAERTLAAVFVRAYFEQGGTLDGVDYTTRAAAADAGGRAYGHLGYGG